ncbi:MAG TPA: SRPBCC family protein [Solirubrobacteraceae bacterium]|nr:SRPBCC family protein [Solirubrobacteraceae bacterium]
MNSDGFGTYTAAGNRPTLSFERRLSHPVDVVWRAITESGELEHWFPCRVEAGELRAGAEMTFTFEHMPLDAASTMTGRVTEYDPPSTFAFTWGEDHLRFELEPLAGEDACLLRLTVLLDSTEKASRDSAGWHICLDRLGGLLDGDGGPAGAGASDQWRELYDEYQRRGVPAGAAIPGD